MTPDSISGRSLYALKEGPSLSVMPSFEAVTKHSVSGVPEPSVGTLRVDVGSGVRNGNVGNTVLEKLMVGIEIVGRGANAESTVASGNVGRDAGVNS
jgi:hypothetical protein